MGKLSGAVFLLFVNGLNAQFLYNSAKDAKSQEALKAAHEIATGQIFDKMTANVDRLSKASSERFFTGAERQMRANVSAFTTWNSVKGFVSKLDTRLHADLPGDAKPAEVKAAAAALETATRNAKTALDSLKKAAQQKFPEQDQINLIGTWFSRLGQLDEILAFATQFQAVQQAVPASFVDAAKEAAGLATTLGKMYSDFQINLPQTPDIVVLEAEIQLLEANENHLKQLALILARREIDLVDTFALIRRVNHQLNYLGGSATGGSCSTPGHYSDQNQAIIDSLSASIAKLKSATDTDRASYRCDLDAMVFVLYNAAALGARDDTPKRLASLRMAEAERRYSIRASAVAARSYETLVATGTQRLANYYKGGLRPETLAQIANALGTIGLIPTISLK